MLQHSRTLEAESGLQSQQLKEPLPHYSSSNRRHQGNMLSSSGLVLTCSRGRQHDSQACCRDLTVRTMTHPFQLQASAGQVVYHVPAERHLDTQQLAQDRAKSLTEVEAGWCSKGCSCPACGQRRAVLLR